MIERACKREARRATLALTFKAFVVALTLSALAFFALHIGFRGGSDAPVKTNVPTQINSLPKWV